MRTWNPNGREKERGGERGFFSFSFPPYLIHLSFLFLVVAMIIFQNLALTKKKKKSDAKFANHHHHHGPQPPLLF
jgi:hypothetical protein